MVNFANATITNPQQGGSDREREPGTGGVLLTKNKQKIDPWASFTAQPENFFAAYQEIGPEIFGKRRFYGADVFRALSNQYQPGIRIEDLTKAMAADIAYTTQVGVSHMLSFGFRRLIEAGNLPAVYSMDRRPKHQRHEKTTPPPRPLTSPKTPPVIQDTTELTFATWWDLKTLKSPAPIEIQKFQRDPLPSGFDSYKKDTITRKARFVTEQNIGSIRTLFEIIGPHVLRPFHRDFLSNCLEKFAGNWQDTLTQVRELPQYQSHLPATLIRAIRFSLNVLLNLENYQDGLEVNTFASYTGHRQQAERVRTFVLFYPTLWDQLPTDIKKAAEMFFIVEPPFTQDAIAKDLRVNPSTVTRYAQRVASYTEYILGQNPRLKSRDELLPNPQTYQPVLDDLYAKILSQLQEPTTHPGLAAAKIAIYSAREAKASLRRFRNEQRKTQRERYLALTREQRTTQRLALKEQRIVQAIALKEQKAAQKQALRDQKIMARLHAWEEREAARQASSQQRALERQQRALERQSRPKIVSKKELWTTRRAQTILDPKTGLYKVKVTDQKQSKRTTEMVPIAANPNSELDLPTAIPQAINSLETADNSDFTPPQVEQLFTMLYGQYEQPIYQYIYRLLGNSEDARDFTHDAFVKAYIKLPETLAKGNFQPRAWLYRIATNVCLDELRHRKGTKWQPWENFISFFHPSQIARENPEREAMQMETRSEVETVLDRLSPRYRAALLLRKYHGLGYAEISDLMGISREAVKAVLLRASESFRLHYNKVYPLQAAQSTGSMVRPRSMGRESQIGAVKRT